MTVIEEKKIATQLMWFGHVQRSPLEALGRRVDDTVFSLLWSGKERSKRTLDKIIERDFMVNNILNNLVFN